MDRQLVGTFNLHTVTSTLFALAAALFGLHYLGQAFDPESSLWAEHFQRLTNLNDELSVSTWYSSALLLIGGLLAMIAGFVDVATQRRGWFLTAAALVFLSADEASKIHEMGDGLHDALGIDTATTFLWVVPYSLAGLVLLAILAPFLRRLPRETARRIVIAGAVFVAAAVGLELVAAMAREVDADGFVDHVTIPVEELLEMVGSTLFILAVLGFLRPRLDRMTLG